MLEDDSQRIADVFNREDPHTLVRAARERRHVNRGVQLVDDSGEVRRQLIDHKAQRGGIRLVGVNDNVHLWHVAEDVEHGSHVGSRPALAVDRGALLVNQDNVRRQHRVVIHGRRRDEEGVFALWPSTRDAHAYVSAAPLDESRGAHRKCAFDERLTLGFEGNVHRADDLAPLCLLALVLLLSLGRSILLGHASRSFR